MHAFLEIQYLWGVYHLSRMVGFFSSHIFYIKDILSLQISATYKQQCPVMFLQSIKDHLSTVPSRGYRFKTRMKPSLVLRENVLFSRVLNRYPLDSTQNID